MGKIICEPKRRPTGTSAAARGLTKACKKRPAASTTASASTKAHRATRVQPLRKAKRQARWPNRSRREAPWACIECGIVCADRRKCAQAIENCEGNCGRCDHLSACRPWACSTCFAPCVVVSRVLAKCQANVGSGRCKCGGTWMPWACPHCGKQCLSPGKCGRASSKSCGCCDCKGRCMPTDFLMIGFVPPGGFLMADTVSRSDFPDGVFPQSRVLFIGDSDISCWGDSGWSRDFPHALNLGVGGATVCELAMHIEATVQALQPKDFVILDCGANDFTESDVSVEETFSYWKIVAEAILQSQHPLQIIYLGRKPEPSCKEDHARYKLYDEMVKAYCQNLVRSSGFSPIIFIDLWSIFSQKDDQDALYQEDGIHMSDVGYSIVTEQVKLVMSGHLGTDWLLTV